MSRSAFTLTFADGSAPQRSLIAQLAAATFGNSSVLFFVIQAATAAVLLLAANTAFNGFPLLTSVLAHDNYAPKALSTRGDRLIFSNGVIALSIAAGVLLRMREARASSGPMPNVAPMAMPMMQSTKAKLAR